MRRWNELRRPPTMLDREEAVALAVDDEGSARGVPRAGHFVDVKPPPLPGVESQQGMNPAAAPEIVDHVLGEVPNVLQRRLGLPSGTSTPARVLKWHAHAGPSKPVARILCDVGR